MNRCECIVLEAQGVWQWTLITMLCQPFTDDLEKIAAMGCGSIMLIFTTIAGLGGLPAYTHKVSLPRGLIQRLGIQNFSPYDK